MVLLRKISLLILCLSTFMLNAQEDLNKAFAESFNYEQTGKFVRGAQALERAYSADSYELNLRLGWLYYKAEQYKTSEKYYSIANTLMPYSVEAKLGCTLPKAKLEMWDEVLQLYNEILTIDSKNTRALYNAGLIHYNRQEYNQSLPLFQELHNLYPTDYSGLLMYGWAALQLGKSREAKVVFKKLLMLYPGDTSGLEAMDLLQ